MTVHCNKEDLAALKVLNGSSLNQNTVRKIKGKSVRAGQTVKFYRYDVPFPDCAMDGVIQGFELREGRWTMRLKHGDRTEIHPVDTIVRIKIENPFILVSTL